MGGGKPYAVVGQDGDRFAKILAKELGVKYTKCEFGDYPHEHLIRLKDNIPYRGSESLEGHHIIFVTRFDQPTMRPTTYEANNDLIRRMIGTEYLIMSFFAESQFFYLKY